MGNFINSIWVGEDKALQLPRIQVAQRQPTQMPLIAALGKLWQRVTATQKPHSLPLMPNGDDHPADNLDALVYIIDASRRFVFVNSKFEELFGVKREEIIGKTSDELIGAQQAENFWHSDQQVLDTGHRIRGIHTLKRPNGNLHHFCYVKSPVSGKKNQVIGIYTDITEFYDHSQELYVRATTDSLTNLNNRSYFFEIFEQQFSAAKRHDMPLTFLTIDIDHFKNINDQYGHPVGDQVIANIGEIISHSLRNEDIAARIGGEEFAILLPNIALDQAQVVAERLRQHVEAMSLRYCDSKPAINVTISIGATAVSHYDLTPDDTYSRADNALYLAKRSGRNQVAARI